MFTVVSALILGGLAVVPESNVHENELSQAQDRAAVLARMTGRNGLQLGAEMTYVQLLRGQRANSSKSNKLWRDVGLRVTTHLLWRPFRARFIHLGIDFGYLYGYRALHRDCDSTCWKQAKYDLVQSWGDIAFAPELESKHRPRWREHGLSIGPRVEWRFSLARPAAGYGRQIEYTGPESGVQIILGLGLQLQLSWFDRSELPRLMWGDRQYFPYAAARSSRDFDFTMQLSCGLAYRGKSWTLSLRYALAHDSLQFGDRYQRRCDGVGSCRTHQIYRRHHGIILGIDWDLLSKRAPRKAYP